MEIASAASAVTASAAVAEHWSIDTWIGVAGLSVSLVLGLAGIGASVGLTVWAVKDSRRQRNEREKAVIAARGVVERSYGLLIGIKPCVAERLGDMHEKAINDGLAAINQSRDILDQL